MLLMMLTIMAAQLLVQQSMDKGLFLVEQRDKLEFGGLPNKSNICRLLLSSIVEEFGLFK